MTFEPRIFQRRFHSPTRRAARATLDHYINTRTIRTRTQNDGYARASQGLEPYLKEPVFQPEPFEYWEP